MRDDGIGVLDAAYGCPMIGAGRALLRAAPGADELCCRCSPVFCVPAGRHDWLNRHVFTGRIEYPGARIVLVHCWLVR